MVYIKKSSSMKPRKQKETKHSIGLKLNKVKPIYLSYI